MPPPSELESGRTKDYLTWWGERRTALLSPCRFMLTSDNDDSSTRGMLLGDDYRTDRFSENYYRHYHGLNRGGMVLGVFFGLVLLVSGVVGAVFIS